jgi:[NiFe] hydrogenase diaphorase moiety large subunit
VDNLLGKAIRGREDFDFDIRIQMGAGAYICGEETR